MCSLWPSSSFTLKPRVLCRCNIKIEKLRIFLRKRKRDLFQKYIANNLKNKDDWIKLNINIKWYIHYIIILRKNVKYLYTRVAVIFEGEKYWNAFFAYRSYRRNKNYIKILAHLKSFLKLLNEVEVLSMSGAAVVRSKLVFCILTGFKNNLNI